MSKEPSYVQLLVVSTLLVTLIGSIFFLTPSLASDLGLVEADCRCCHGASLADRHHLLVPESGLECLDCHDLTYNDTNFQFDVALVRDCLECHTGSLADRHHLAAPQGGYECFDCHALVFNPETSRYDTGFNFFCEAPTAPTTTTPVATVTGRVSDQNGSGLAWATVTTEGGSSALTSENGEYQLVDIPATNHTLVATLNGYSSEQQTLSVMAPLTSAVDFALTQQPVESCDDGLDNDNDGLIDCVDTDCSTTSTCSSAAVENCADELDNDNDGLIDCADSDCSLTIACMPPPVEICMDGFDNDGNGQTDCADDKCLSFSACLPLGVLENCHNGIDDDNNGQTDCADGECSDDPACNLAKPVEFFDDSDDSDGRADWRDASARFRTPTPKSCDNGIKDNGDGKIDCKHKFAYGETKGLSLKRERAESSEQLPVSYRSLRKKHLRSVLLQSLQRQD